MHFTNSIIVIIYKIMMISFPLLIQIWFFFKQKRSLSPSTYVDYDFDGLEESCGSNDDINLLKCEKVVTCTANKSFLLPPTSEDEGDSALSGRSSELNENR